MLTVLGFTQFAEDMVIVEVDICESTLDESVVDAVSDLERLGFTLYMLAVPEYNLRMLQEKNKVSRVKKALSKFTFPYIQRVLGRTETSRSMSTENG